MLEIQTLCFHFTLEKYILSLDEIEWSWMSRCRFYCDLIPKSARLYIWNLLTACSKRESVHHQKQIAMIQSCASGEAVRAFLNFFTTRSISFWDGKKAAVVWNGQRQCWCWYTFRGCCWFRSVWRDAHNAFYCDCTMTSFGYDLMQVMVVCAAPGDRRSGENARRQLINSKLKSWQISFDDIFPSNWK